MEERVQEKSAQENVFGIDEMREEVIGPLAREKQFEFVNLVWRLWFSYYKKGKETVQWTRKS